MQAEVWPLGTGVVFVDDSRRPSPTGVTALLNAGGSLAESGVLGWRVASGWTGLAVCLVEEPGVLKLVELAVGTRA